MNTGMKREKANPSLFVKRLSFFRVHERFVTKRGVISYNYAFYLSFNTNKLF